MACLGALSLAMRLGASTTIAVLVLGDPDVDTSLPRGQLLPFVECVQLLGKLIRARRLVGAWAFGRGALRIAGQIEGKANGN